MSINLNCKNIFIVILFALVFSHAQKPNISIDYVQKTKHVTRGTIFWNLQIDISNPGNDTIIVIEPVQQRLPKIMLRQLRVEMRANNRQLM